MWENAYLGIKNPKASRAHLRALDPSHRLVTSLAWLCFAMSATFGLRIPLPNPGSAPDGIRSRNTIRHSATQKRLRPLEVPIMNHQVKFFRVTDLVDTTFFVWNKVYFVSCFSDSNEDVPKMVIPLFLNNKLFTLTSSNTTQMSRKIKEK